ncbi:MAG: synaptobrevin family protein [Sulfobacillus sp.]
MESGHNSDFQEVRIKIDDVKGIMLNSIEKLASRGEKIEDLAERTEILQSNAVNFRHEARQLSCRQKCRSTCLVIGVVAGILVFIAVVVISAVCGSGRC